MFCQHEYCKRANVRGGFNFAIFAVDDFSAKFNHRNHFASLITLEGKNSVYL